VKHKIQLEIELKDDKYCCGCRFHEYDKCRAYDVHINVDLSQSYFSPIRCDECLGSN